MTPSSDTLLRPFARRFNRSVEEARNAAKARRRRVAMRHILSTGEQLEQRLAMTIEAFIAPNGGGVTSGYVTLVATEGDDIYVQQTAPASQDQTVYTPALLYADNSSFANARQIEGIDIKYSDLVVTAGGVVKGIDTKTELRGDGFPFYSAGGNTTKFNLGYYLWAPRPLQYDEYREINVRGTISNGVGGLWRFDKPVGSLSLAFSALNAVGPRPLAGIVDGDTLFSYVYDQMDVSWDTSRVGVGGLSSSSPPMVESIEWSDAQGAVFNSGGGIRPASPSLVEFPLPMPGDLPAAIIPGALLGKVFLEQSGESVDFRLASAGGSTTLVFGPNNQESFPLTGLSRGSLSGDAGITQLSGQLVTRSDGTPAVRLSFADNSFNSYLTPIPGAVAVSANYAVAASGAENVSVSDFTLSAGQDVTRRLRVDMGQPGAAIRINSPVSNAASVDLRATQILLNAPIASASSFIVGASAAGTSCDDLQFNAAVQAKTYDLRIGDDGDNSPMIRSRLYVSPSGSLGGGLVGGTIDNAATLFALVTGGDIFIEGTVAATTQSWFMQSRPAASPDAVPTTPYVMSTTAVVSGASTGLIKGRSVAITLGNDLPSLYDNTDIGGSTALSVVTLQTDIDSLRITAADRKGNPLATAFPFDVQVKEGFQGGDGNISIDAVSSSSRALEFQAKNNITFNAALESAADVIVSSEAGQINMRAPLSTAFGSIELSANSLTIGNSIRVLDTTFSPTGVDIILTARNGDMLLNGPIAAVNGILLTQTGTGNVIRGPSRLIADRLEIQAEGSADLVTSVREVLGSVGGGISINEADSLLISDLSAGDRRVNVTVGGEDYYLSNSDGTPDMDSGKQAALKANLTDVNEIVVSAPLGSIDVFIDSTKDIVLGNIAAIQSRTATSMTAAGSVSILTSAAGIVAYDAPVAGASARQVAVASTGNLAGTFLSRQPGVYSATLTGLGSLAAQDLVLDGIQGLRAGDLILLKDQTAGLQNGIYRVISVGSAAAGGKWTLARTSDLDTSAEAKLNTWIRPLRGGTQAQKLFALTSFGDADDDLAFAQTSRRVTTVTNVGSSYAVKAVSSAAFTAQYTVEDDVSGGKVRTLSGSKEGAIPLFDGVKVAEGDTVFVRQGHISDAVLSTNSIGVYVVEVAGDDTVPWKLRSVNDFQIGRIVANEGSLRASKTGQAFEVAYDYLNNATMTIDVVGDSDVYQQIGSGDINDAVKFVVSTNLGTNNSLGSFGKMLTLVQSNSVSVDDPELDGSTIPQTQTIAFASTLGGTVGLTQALPAIRTQIVLDASTGRVAVPSGGLSTIVLDGSKITTASDFTPVGSTGTANGLEFIGTEASGSVLNGIVFGGFGKGAAVVADAASDLLISNLRIGENAAGVKLGNKQGIIVRNGSGGFTTLLNNSIRASTGAAIQVAGDNADNSVRIVGNTIGGAAAGSGTGIELGGGKNLVGTAPIDVTLKRLSVTKVKNSATQFLLPPGFAQLSQLRIGLGVVSSRITAPVGSPAATITSISAPDAAKAVTIEIDGVIEGVGTSLVVDMGVFVQPQDDNASRFKLPACVDIADVFLGQTISGVNVAVGTTITMIEKGDDGDYTLTLSKPFLRSEAQAVVFGAGGRNQVLFNNYGIVQRAGVSRIYNTTVGASVFDGIKIDAGEAFVGLGSNKKIGVDGRSPSKDRDSSSNFIYGSGLAGVRVATTVPVGNIQIQGNYLGVTSSGAASVNKSGNIVGSSGLVDKLLTGSVTAASADGRVLTISLANHGLSDGMFVWLKIGTNAVGNSYRVARLGQNTFTAELAGVATVVIKPAVGNMVKVSVYGSKTTSSQLAGTGGVDFEGNQHGLAVALPSVGAGNTATAGGSGKTTGGVSTRRPVLKPVARPVRR